MKQPSFIMKVILRDLCTGGFNTDQLSGEAELESFHKKNKIGDYNPRHARRMLNDELKNLIYKKGRIDQDKRKISYGSAFNMDPTKLGSIPDEAKKMWEEEIGQILGDQQNRIIFTKTSFLTEIYPERWSDLVVLKKKMLDILESFDGEIKSTAYFSSLQYEVSSFSPYFNILSNYINSLSEIFWFMKKSEDKRASILDSHRDFKVDEKDIDQTLTIMHSIGLNNRDIALRLVSVPHALISFGFDSLALELLNRITALAKNTEIERKIGLEYVSMLRNQEKYTEMLEISTNLIENYGLDKDRLTFILLKIRNAEALSFNGNQNLAVKQIEDIFRIRDQFGGSYNPNINIFNKLIEYELTEKESLPEAGSVPVRVSILKNLISAALRIGEYCLAKKYLEELFDSESNYFKREDALDSFLNLQQVYNKMIFRCDPRT